MMSGSVPAEASTTSLAIASNEEEAPPSHSTVSQGYFWRMARSAASYAAHCVLADDWMLVVSLTGGCVFAAWSAVAWPPVLPQAASSAAAGAPARLSRMARRGGRGGAPAVAGAGAVVLPCLEYRIMVESPCTGCLVLDTGRSAGRAGRATVPARGRPASRES